MTGAADGMPPEGARALIFGCSGPDLTAEEAAFFSLSRPFGFILFARNIDTPDRLAGLCADLRAAVGWGAPILIDQEGGRVARLRGPYWREWPAVGEWCARADGRAPGLPSLSENDLLEALRLRYRVIGAELRAVGVDVDCAPLLDVRAPDGHGVIGDRALGWRPSDVARRASVIADALKDAGVSPVLKHLPGHGRAGVDSHEASPVVDAPRATLEAVDFAAFAPLSRRSADFAPYGMTAHVIYARLDAENVATMSPTVIREVIRSRLNFDGLLMTDDLSMGALEGPMGARGLAALAAGCDALLHCNGELEEMRALSDVAPELQGAARRRAEAACAGRSAPRPLDLAAADARIAALTGWNPWAAPPPPTAPPPRMTALAAEPLAGGADG